MIKIQNIEISWTKEARGGKLATRRNAVPHAFEISSERKYLRIENCIAVKYESARFDDDTTDKQISVVGNLIFEVENDVPLIKIPKYNGYDKKIARLHHNESVRLIRFSKSMDYEHTTTYHKSIVNLVCSNETIPADYFITLSFSYVFDEKSFVWYS